MVIPYKLTIPETVGAMQDLLASMQLTSPDFTHHRFPGMNIDTTFAELIAGLGNIRKVIGENGYQVLVEMSVEMRARFDVNEVRDGNIIAYEMQEILSEVMNSKKKNKN